MDPLLNNIVTNVPEPETYALFLAGLGMLVFSWGVVERNNSLHKSGA